jgi:hypothetical protein
MAMFIFEGRAAGANQNGSVGRPLSKSYPNVTGRQNPSKHRSPSTVEPGMDMTTSRQRCRKSVAVAGFFLFAASSGGAQSPDGPYRNVFTLNPLGIPFEYFSVEYERANGLTSLGLTGSYLSNDESYSTLEGKIRFYPNETAPHGFSVGLAAGVTRYTEDVFVGSFPNDRIEERAKTFPTVAVIIDYNWLLGRNKRFLVGAGVGGKRLLGDDDDQFFSFPRGYPTARFQLGLLF